MFQRILYIFNIVLSRLEFPFNDIESKLLISSGLMVLMNNLTDEKFLIPVVVTVIYTTLSIKFVIVLICATKI